MICGVIALAQSNRGPMLAAVNSIDRNLRMKSFPSQSAIIQDVALTPRRAAEIFCIVAMGVWTFDKGGCFQARYGSCKGTGKGSCRS